MCCICFSNTLKQGPEPKDDYEGVCCICFSNTLKQKSIRFSLPQVCVVFVLAILSNVKKYIASVYKVCVVFVLAILSNKGKNLVCEGMVCVVFVLAILSNKMARTTIKFVCVLYLF